MQKELRRKGKMPDEIIEVPDNYSMAVPQSTGDKVTTDFLDKMRPEEIVEVIRQKLLGKEYIKGEWKSVDALKNRRLSEVGAWEISNLALGIANIGMSISRIDKNQANERLRSVNRSAQRNMVTSWRSYGVTSSSQYYYVKEILFSLTQAVLFQATGGSIQELFKSGIIHENRTYSDRPRESKIKRLGRALGL